MLFATVLILVAFSFAETQWNFGFFRSKKIDYISELLLTGKAQKVPLPTVIVSDSIIAKDSVAVVQRQFDITEIIDFNSDSTPELAPFFESLTQTLKSKNKTRIAYFGDSMIEGDLISQDFRSSMQSQFGGYGVGFVPITSHVSGFRTSVIHSFKDWVTYNLLEEIPNNHSLGISGYAFVPSIMNTLDTTDINSGSWVKYVAVNKNHIDKFNTIKLLYGKSDKSNYVILNGKRYLLKGTEPVNELQIEQPNYFTKVDARFQCESPLDIYGFSLESDSGVFVDNFSFRGNSGLTLSKIKKEVYEATQAHLDYDLIVLEYGLNAISPQVKDFSWYELGMDKVIKLIRSSFPNTSILLVSVGDKAYKNGNEFYTDPSVPIMVNAQKRLAQKNNIAFWSLYDAMGGYGSMVKWVEGDTVLANKDYTHLNYKGAKKVGRLLYEKIMSEYRDYKKMKFSVASVGDKK